METSSPPLLELFEELSRACADGVTGMPAGDLLRLVTDAGTLHRALDAIRVRLAGELAAQSAVHLGADGIARRAGHSTPASFLAELWQISPAEAARLCDVSGWRCARGSRSTGQLFRPDTRQSVLRWMDWWWGWKLRR